MTIPKIQREVFWDRDSSCQFLVPETPCQTQGKMCKSEPGAPNALCRHRETPGRFSEGCNRTLKISRGFTFPSHNPGGFPGSPFPVPSQGWKCPFSELWKNSILDSR